jgi:beta-phosphoglucomutase family hydrolase
MERGTDGLCPRGEVSLICGTIARMTMRKTAVLWDMDGVLVDTQELHYQTWARVLAEQGIPFDRQKFRQIFGMVNHDLLVYLTGREPTPEYLAWISDYKETAFRRLMHGQVQLLPGVRHWLERLQALGCKQAVASSAPPENIEELVDELDIRDYFDALVSAHNMPGKPHPAVFLEAARRVEAQPAECVVIEDSLAGVEAARRAGMFCIAVTTSNPPHALAHADVVVERLEGVDCERYIR